MLQSEIHICGGDSYFVGILSLIFSCSEEAISTRNDPIPANLLCQYDALQPFRKVAEQWGKEGRKLMNKKTLRVYFKSTVW